ncbi:MAG: DinB family protein, partial [Longimicrobiales bacterium]
NDKVTQALLADFRAARERLVARLESLPADELGATALHPRLRQQMSVADLFYFVAEHDDHHLARIRELIASD